MTIRNRKCVFCKEETARLKYCSERCKQMFERTLNGANVDCVHCGKRLEGSQRAYCSQACRMDSKGKMLVDGRWVSKTTAPCRHCGKHFHRRSKNHMYCTQACKEDFLDSKKPKLEKPAASSDWVVYTSDGHVARYRHVQSRRQHTRGDWLHKYELEYHFKDGKVRREPLEQSGRMITPGQLDQLFILVFANHSGPSHHEAASNAAQ